MLSTEGGSQVVVISGGWRNGHRQIRGAEHEIGSPGVRVRATLRLEFVGDTDDRTRFESPIRRVDCRADEPAEYLATQGDAKQA
jgi:hypothetical protein